MLKFVKLVWYEYERLNQRPTPGDCRKPLRVVQTGDGKNQGTHGNGEEGPTKGESVYLGCFVACTLLIL